TVDPPPGSNLLTKTLPHVVVGTAPVDLGTIVLDGGFVVTGHVTGGGQPVPNVNVNALDSRTGAQWPTSRDHTDALGNFRVVVAAPSTSLGTLTLRAGVLLQGNVKAAAVPNAPIGDVNVNLFAPGTATQVLTAHDHTDFLGHFAIAVTPGTYDVQALPPAGT